SCVRNPYDMKVSIFRYDGWWSNDAPHDWMERTTRQYPHFPNLSFEEFVESWDRLTGGPWRNAKLNPFARTMGQYSHLFIGFFFKGVPEIIKMFDEDFIQKDRYKEHMYDVHFLHVERLNRDLYEFLLKRGYPEQEVRFILKEQKVWPAGSTRRQHEKWQDFYTPRMKKLVRTRERLLFRLFPEFDDEEQ
ncbi:unnamed protein product, partial [marine sediment metagenome]